MPYTESRRRPLAASSAILPSSPNTPISWCICQVHLMWWRMRCPARRRPPPPGSNGSAQPSPTNHP
ncbi:MAG: hypothetical protein ACK55Z_26630 [bacterium]